jgi:predicted PhzF superfamily epimerase YddE/YHI9
VEKDTSIGPAGQLFSQTVFALFKIVGFPGVVMSFPSNPPTAPSSEDAKSVYDSIVMHAVQPTPLPIHSVLYSRGTKKLLVRLDDTVTREQVEALVPHQAGMYSVDQSMLASSDRVTGVSVTVKSSPDTFVSDGHFLSRYFTPWNGIPEDPVNGSSHTALGPYWAEQLGCSALTAVQCSRRCGKLCITCERDRVKLGGNAVILMAGSLHSPSSA